MAKLAPGDYVLDATPYVLDGGAAVRVEAGETRNVEVRLKKAPAVSIRGKLIDPEPKTGMTSLLLATRDAPDRYLFPSSTRIEADGSFVIADVTPGEYLLYAVRQGMATLTGSVPASGVWIPFTAAARFVQVGGGNLDGITLELPPIFELRGSVMANAQCRLAAPVDFSARMSLVPQVPGAPGVRADNQGGGDVSIDVGGFKLPNVARMPYRVTVSNNGDCFPKSIRYAGQETKDGIVDFARDDGPLEIVFAMGQKLEGWVVDHDGRPSPGAEITLTPRNAAASAIQSVHAGRDGSFTLRGIGPGAYNLFAWEATFESAPRLDLPRRLLAFERRGTPVTVEKAASSLKRRIEVISAADIASISGPLAAPPPVKAKGGIAGQVLDGASGAPLKGAILKLQGWREATPETSAKTDESGRFEFRDLMPGFYNLSAQHRRYAGATYGGAASPFGSIILGEGQDLTAVELRLSPRP